MVPSIAPLESADFAALWNMHRACFDNPTTAESLFAEVKSSHAIALKISSTSQENDLLGYAIASIVLDECSLLYMAVAEAARGKGYGIALVTHLLSHARTRGATRILLEVRVDNQAAKRLYAACGFTTLATRSSYYSDGTDALVLERRIGLTEITTTNKGTSRL